MRIRNFFVVVTVAALFFSSARQHVVAQTASSTPDQQARQELQQQLQDIENQISQIQQQLNTIKGQKNTLLNKISQLQKQQAALNLQIQATNLQINDLSGQLQQTEATITDNETYQKHLQDQIAALIRTINERDATPILYTAITQSNWSTMLDDVRGIEQTTQSLQDVLQQTQAVKAQLDQEQRQLASQEDQAKNFLSVQVLQQAQLTDSVSAQNTLLQQTKGKESDYQITLNDTQKRAAEIRNRIYQLFGVTKNITFGQAVQIAQGVSDLTGVEPAFLLAILTQESNLGQNVGTCNRPGDTPSKSYKVIMKPDRDIQPFLEITQSLGMDPNTTPVSCPMRDSRGRQVGWGGAMGPAQFIPSTWIGYKDQVSQITGSSPANPWDIRDAFVAAAIKLKADGADNTEQGEWNAAMRYFSGSTSTKYRFYGDSVIEQTQKYKSDIADLNK